MDKAANNSNVRITQAVLANIVEANTKALDKIDRKLGDYDERIRDLENSYVGLETRVNVWSGINSLGAAVATVLGVFGIKQ